MNKTSKTILIIVGILLIIYILYLWMQHNKQYKNNQSGSGQATLGPGYQIYPPVYDPGLFVYDDYNIQTPKETLSK